MQHKEAQRFHPASRPFLPPACSALTRLTGGGLKCSGASRWPESAAWRQKERFNFAQPRLAPAVVPHWYVVVEGSLLRSLSGDATVEVCRPRVIQRSSCTLAAGPPSIHQQQVTVDLHVVQYFPVLDQPFEASRRSAGPLEELCLGSNDLGDSVDQALCALSLHTMFRAHASAANLVPSSALLVSQLCQWTPPAVSGRVQCSDFRDCNWHDP
jgi:hypothetical protein